jgi:hypothetical protein
MNNILTIDFESWVHTYESSLDSNARKSKDNGDIYDAGIKLIDLLDKYNAKATFFVVGEIHDWYPDLIDKIKNHGHEIALHSFSHRLFLDEEVFKDELLKSVAFINKYNIKGIRAPRLFSKQIYNKYLSEYSILYSSSTYGSIDNIEKQNGIYEIPISTLFYKEKNNRKLFYGPLSLKLLFNTFPFGSPYLLSINRLKTMSIISTQNRMNKSTMLCLHNWQLFTPKKSGDFLLYLLKHEISSFPYFFNIHNNFIKLLSNFKFISISEYLLNTVESKEDPKYLKNL